MIPSSIPSASPLLLKARGQGSPQGYPGSALPSATRSRSFAPPSPFPFAQSRSLLRPDHQLLVGKLEECSRLSRAYQHHQAAGFDDPALAQGEALTKLDRTRELAEAEIGGLKAAQERVERLELDRDALLKSMAAKVPEDLDGLTGTSATRSTGCSGSPSRPPPRASRSPGR